MIDKRGVIRERDRKMAFLSQKVLVMEELNDDIKAIFRLITANLEGTDVLYCKYKLSKLYSTSGMCRERVEQALRSLDRLGLVRYLITDDTNHKSRNRYVIVPYIAENEPVFRLSHHGQAINGYDSHYYCLETLTNLLKKRLISNEYYVFLGL